MVLGLGKPKHLYRKCKRARYMAVIENCEVRATKQKLQNKTTKHAINQKLSNRKVTIYKKTGENTEKKLKTFLAIYHNQRIVVLYT